MAYTQKTYTESDAVKKWREQMEAQMGLKPADYVSKYQDQLNSTMDSILNRKEFQYDVNNDALYNMYKDRYVNLGQNAMMDTMGQAAKLTGGYGNSNALMVGQQAYQNYLQGLTDKIPELAKMAEARYNQQGQDLYNRYGLLNSQEQLDYNRWNDLYNQWQAERDYLTNLYNTERGYDYGVFRDSVADAQWKAQFDEDLRRFELQWAAAHPAAVGGGGGGSSGGGSGSSNYQKVANELKATGDYAKDVQGDMATIRANVASGAISTSQAKELVKNYVSTKR